jgi:hypothetical protein
VAIIVVPLTGHCPGRFPGTCRCRPAWNATSGPLVNQVRNPMHPVEFASPVRLHFGGQMGEDGEIVGCVEAVVRERKRRQQSIVDELNSREVHAAGSNPSGQGAEDDG